MPSKVKRRQATKHSRVGRQAHAPRSPEGWSRIVEAATLAREPGDLKAARAAFDSLPQQEQMQLVRELADTRRAELTRAYADLISVSAGYRLKRDKQGVRRVTPEVCAILVVKKKWRPKGPGARARRVPEHLFAYWTIDGERTLCAVPTDVEDGHRLRRIHPQAQIVATAPAVTKIPIKGAIACAITRDNDDTVYAIGCRHVFGMGLVLDPAKHYGADIRVVDQAAVLGKATPVAGRLGNGPDLSFDSHLARVFDMDALRTALGGVKATQRAQDWGDLQQGIDYWIITPAGPLRANFVGHYVDPISYTDSLNDVRHFDLAKFLLPDGATDDGHSGSPVMADKTGGKLIGMHIAGDGRDMSLVIPAWQLFHAPWYGVGDETWHLWHV